jgi:NarL family two-component system response regulator LiaR
MDRGNGDKRMSQRQPIKVMVVDDHLMVRDGLKMFLSLYDDLEIVAEAGDGQQAIDTCQKIQPDVILMDVVMPNVDGPTATAAIKRGCPSVQVIALSTFSEQELVKRAIEAGAIGYLLKDVHADKLAQAVRDAHRGRSTLAAGAAQSLIQATTKATPIGPDLTPREREVLALLVDGKTNRQIAEQLTISPATARLHVSNILSKLNAANRTEAATLALQHNLLS